MRIRGKSSTKAPTEKEACIGQGLEKRSGWLEHEKKGGERYRMRPNSQRPAHAGQSWEFLPSEVGGQEGIIGKGVT